MRYEFLINIGLTHKTHKTHFVRISDISAFYSVVHFQLPTVKLFEISAHCENIILSLFIDSSIDNVLLQTNPDFTSLFLNSKHFSERHLVNIMLHNSQTL